MSCSRTQDGETSGASGARFVYRNPIFEFSKHRSLQVSDKLAELDALSSQRM